MRLPTALQVLQVQAGSDWTPTATRVGALPLAPKLKMFGIAKNLSLSLSKAPKRQNTRERVYYLLGAALMMKFCKNLAGPCPAPTYLPTYLPYLCETKKEITGSVKVGYYTN